MHLIKDSSNNEIPAEIRLCDSCGKRLYVTSLISWPFVGNQPPEYGHWEKCCGCGKEGIYLNPNFPDNIIESMGKEGARKYLSAHGKKEKSDDLQRGLFS